MRCASTPRAGLISVSGDATGARVKPVGVAFAVFQLPPVNSLLEPRPSLFVGERKEDDYGQEEAAPEEDSGREGSQDLAQIEGSAQVAENKSWA
jgi:hypothetical protein